MGTCSVNSSVASAPCHSTSSFGARSAGHSEADIYFGLHTAAEQERAAELMYPKNLPPVESPMGLRVFGEGEWGDWVVPSRLAAVVPGAGGVGDALGIARVGQIVAMNGQVNGRHYLGTDVIQQATCEQSYREDEMLGWCRYGLGFGLPSPEFASPTPSTVH